MAQSTSRRVDNPSPQPAGQDIPPTGVLSHLLKLNMRLAAPFSAYLEKQHKISVNEFRMLMTIGRLGTTASHELADETGVSTMGVSRAIAALHRHHRVLVETDPANRRRKILRLSEEGERLFRSMAPVTDRVASYLCEALRPDEIMAFDRYLVTLINGLEARDATGRLVFLDRTRPG